MKEVFAIADNILSPLGKNSSENFSQLKSNQSGIRLHSNPKFSALPCYASLFEKENSFPLIKNEHTKDCYSKFEQLLINSIQDAVGQSSIDPSDPETILIISTTKGNISMLEETDKEEISSALSDLTFQQRISIPYSARLVSEFYNCHNQPLIISHACISGVLAIITAMRMLQSGLYKHAIVSGADVLSAFIISGFQSFQAISNLPCKPFDAKRNGVTLGEGAATIILSTEPAYSKSNILISGGAVSNDANHISGPSRTGEELATAIRKSLLSSNMDETGIDFVSAHGTATVYNDEMECKALHLEHLENKPVNSLKGFYGHTLGAAGLIETIASIHSLKENLVLPTKGYEEPGTSKPLNVCSTLQSGNLRSFLKTASGFGGCNAALVVRKLDNSVHL